jgi:hypothetical protein
MAQRTERAYATAAILNSYLAGGGRTLRANDTNRHAAKMGSARKVDIGMDVVSSRCSLALKAAECAATHTVHLAGSVPLWICAADATENQNVRTRHNSATYFTMDCNLPPRRSPRIYTKERIVRNVNTCRCTETQFAHEPHRRATTAMLCGYRFRQTSFIGSVHRCLMCMLTAPPLAPRREIATAGESRENIVARPVAKAGPKLANSR